MKNEQIFAKQSQELKEKEELVVQRQSLEATITHACKMLPELHILEDAVATTKIRKLVVVVRELKDEIY